MEWNEKGIAMAIQEAKSKGSIFIVLVQGDDHETDTENCLALLGDPEVPAKLGNNYVAIRVKAGTQSCAQFSSLYPVILVPSIYFIDSSTGVDLEVLAGGPGLTKEALLSGVSKAVSKAISKASRAGNEVASRLVEEASAGNGAVASPRGARVERARQILQGSVVASEGLPQGQPHTEAPEEEEVMGLEERVARAKRLLAQRKAKDQDQEAEKEKRLELDRRALGKNLQEAKRLQEDEEVKKLARERLKDKEDERIARERIKAQIAEDRARKAAKFEEHKAAQELLAAQNQERENREAREKAQMLEQRRAADASTDARVQFRLPDGGSRLNSFPADAPLSELYKFVGSQIDDLGFSSFSLTTSFPRRNLDNEDKSSSLRSLGFAPSGTVLVLPLSANHQHHNSVIGSSGTSDLLGYAFWLFLTPLTFLWKLLASFFPTNDVASPATSGDSSSASSSNERRSFGNKHQSANPRDTTSPSSGSGIRRRGNFATLGSSDDDDDETNTYNGNSTQQM